MYNELNEKCDEMILALMAARTDCVVDDTSLIKDTRSERLLKDADRAINALEKVKRTIKNYF